MKTNLIQITEANAPVLNSIVSNPGWEQFELILKQAYEKAGGNLQDATKDIEVSQGIARAFDEICHIKEKIDEVLNLKE